MIARVVATLVLAAPQAAWACATCVASAYGDRTFNWAFLGLLLMPFAVGLGIVAVLATRYYLIHVRSTSRSSRGAVAVRLTHEESAL